MTACSHCVDQREHPSFVLLLEAADAQTGDVVRVHWDHSQQPLRFVLAQQAPWRMKLVVGPFLRSQRAVRFQTVLQRVFADAASATTADRRSGAITLARKWLEIEGVAQEEEKKANELRVYATDDEGERGIPFSPNKEAARSLQLVREAVHILAS